MAQDLQTSSPAVLPAIDVREPSTLLFLPPWLATQIAAVSDLGAGRTILDPKTRAVIGRVATIPRSKMPTGAQRQAIAQRIEELHRAARPGPIETTIKMLGEIVNEHAPARLDDDTADIKIGAYLDAVDDLPAWAIREAMRRWRRGEVSGDARDLDFAPKPPRLRRLAQSIAATASGQAIRLQRILDAQPEDEMPEEARAENQKRLVAVLKDIGEPAIEPAGSAAAERAQARRELNERILAVEAERKARIAERDAAESEAIDV